MCGRPVTGGLSRGNIMKALTLYAISFTVVAFSTFGADAQEKCKRTSEYPGSTATYTQQHVIDVGDVPGHQIRIIEAHRTFPKDDRPNCEGLKTTEKWSRAFYDYIDGNGRTWGYTVAVLENGDNIFGTYDGTVETVIDSDGSKKTLVTTIESCTGGTGKYVGIRGLSRNTAKVDKEGIQSRYDSEYWFQK
jgi:hypothetical protein